MCLRKNEFILIHVPLALSRIKKGHFWDKFAKKPSVDCEHPNARI